jgi:hypothetical protein
MDKDLVALIALKTLSLLLFGWALYKFSHSLNLIEDENVKAAMCFMISMIIAYSWVTRDTKL